MGFVFQSYNLIPHQTVLENVELALTLSGVSRKERRKRAVEAIVQKYAELAVDPEHSRVAITHGDCLADAEDLAMRVRAVAQPGELIICPHEPFTGSHVGPGMLALFFIGKHR